jgi:cytochrome c oxidase subunit 2
MMRNKQNRFKLAFFFCLACLSSMVMAAVDPWQMNMPQGVTPLSHQMYELHMIAIWVCVAIGVLVFGVMFYALIHHRKSKGHAAATFHENLRLEIIWSVIPFLILVGLAIPATRILMRMEDTDRADLTIKIVGYQWKWEYIYLDQKIDYFSILSTPYAQIQNQAPKNDWYLLEVDKPLVLPIHKKIRFLVTSNDVIHSWWVPDLGVKRDAIPGFMHEAWTRIDKPGVYRGQCAELCGINHAFMPIVVNAVSEEEFNQWVAQQQSTIPAPTTLPANAANTKPPATATLLTREELMTLGKTKYDTMCAACHRPDGLGIPPYYPALKGSSVAVGHPISRHIDLILNGVPGSAMQPYAAQLNDEEIAAIVTYERNAWTNNTGDVVQPNDVAIVRQSHQQEPKRVTKARAGGFQ